MLSMVNNLILTGMTAAQILNFISKKVKNLGSGIEGARSQGYSDNDILKFLSGKMPKSSSKEAQESSDDYDRYLKASGLKTRAEKQDTINKGIKGALGAATLAGSAYGLYNQYASRFPKNEWDFTRGQVPQDALQIEGKAQAQIPYNPGMEKGPQGPNQFQMVPDPIQPPQQTIQQAKQPGINPLPSGTLPQAAQQAPAPQAMPNKMQELGLEKTIEKMRKNGMSVKDIAKYHSENFPDFVKRKEQELKMPFQNIVEREFMKGDQKGRKPGLVEGLTNEVEGAYPSSGISRNAGDLVQMPDGSFGVVEHVKTDHAVVDVDGKKKPVKLDDIQDLPIPEKDLADLHEELIRGIEKETGQQVSRNVDWAGYEPDTNRLAYRPWDGSLYVYEDISPEDAEVLTGLLTKRKTTGENFIGSWKAGSESPIGAAMSALIQRLQKERGGKGKEYSGKFQTVYSATEPAVKAAKAKAKRKKDEEKKRKKQQR
jgi:hypothetical protein